MKLHIATLMAITASSFAVARDAKLESMFPEETIRFSPSLLVPKRDGAIYSEVRDIERVRLEPLSFEGPKKVHIGIPLSRLANPSSKYDYDLLTTAVDPRLDLDLVKIRDTVPKVK